MWVGHTDIRVIPSTGDYTADQFSYLKKLGPSKDLRSWLRGFVPTADGSPAQWLLERATTAWSETVRRGEYRAARATRRQRGANSTSVPTANSNIDIMALTTANIGRLSVPDLQKLVQTHQIPLPAAGTGRRSWRNADLNSMLLAHIDTLRQPERHRTAACNRREHDLEQQVEAASGRDGAITHERTEAQRDEFEQHALQQHGHREPLFAMPPAVVWAIMPLWAVPGHGPSQTHTGGHHHAATAAGLQPEQVLFLATLSWFWVPVLAHAELSLQSQHVTISQVGTAADHYQVISHCT